MADQLKFPQLSPVDIQGKLFGLNRNFDLVAQQLAALKGTVASSTTGGGGGTAVNPGGYTPGLIPTVTFVEDIAKRYFDPTSKALHTFITVIPNFPTSTPVGSPMSLWFDEANGAGYQYILTNSYPGPGFAFDVDVLVPLDPTQGNWKGAVSSGIFGAGDPPPAGAAFNTFTVTTATAVSPASISAIQFVNNPVSGDPFNYDQGDAGIYTWGIYQLEWTQPTKAVDPYYLASFFTIELGHATTGIATITGGVNLAVTSGATFTSGQVGYEIHVNNGSVVSATTIATFVDANHVTLTDSVPNGTGQTFEVWNPAPTPNGQNQSPILADPPWKGGFVASSDQLGASGYGSQVVYRSPIPPPWGVIPPLNYDGTTNLNVTWRVRVYAVSVLGQNAVSPQPQAQVFTLCTGWPLGADHFDLTPSPPQAALDLSRSNVNRVGNGLQLTGPHLAAYLGYTMGFNGSGQITLFNLIENAGLPTLPNALYPAGSVILNTLDMKLYRNTDGSTWVKTVDPADLVAGTITATVAMTSPVLTITSGSITVNIDATNFIKMSHTSGAYSQMTYTGFDVVDSGGAVSGIGTGGFATANSVGGPPTSAIGPTFLVVNTLPSVSPGVGSKQFWYDPADGNRVKYAA